MNANLISTRAANDFSSVINGLIANALSLAIIAVAGILTFTQFIAIA